MASFEINFPNDTVEVHNPSDFDIVAAALGVQVGTRGQKPKRQLVEAIQAAKLTLVDTDYLSAAHAAPKARETSQYGAELAKLKATRDAAIQAAKDEFVKARDALRERFQGSAGSAFQVTAKTPQRDKETGAVRTSSKGKTMWLPGSKTVTLTMDQIREHGDTGTRGMPSESQILRAAAVAGDWLPLDVLGQPGWATEYVRDASVERVSVGVDPAENAA